MNKNNQTVMMADYLITFFIGRHTVTKLLSEVITNKDNKLFYEEIGLPWEFKIPFFQEKGDNELIYTIKQNPDDRFEAMLFNEPVFDHVIQDNDYLSFTDTQTNRSFHIMFEKTEKVKPGYKKYRLFPNQKIFIGRSPNNNIIFDFNSMVSRDKHIALQVNENGAVRIEDLKRSVPVYLNGNRVISEELKPFDEIFFMGLRILFLGDSIAVSSNTQTRGLTENNRYNFKQPAEPDEDQKYFVRAPRILKSLNIHDVEIDAPPAPPTLDQTPAILVIGPSLTMALVMLVSLSVSISSALSGGSIGTVISSLIMALGMFIGAVLWPTLLRNYQKRKVIADEEYRDKRYTAYIYDIENELTDLSKNASQLLNDTLEPEPAELCSLLDNESNMLRLWERSYQDIDFLNVRVGKGEQPLPMEIKIPREGFVLNEDHLRELPKRVKEQYSVLRDVPVSLDIRKNKAIGLIGDKPRIRQILDEIILNLIALHSYDEVKLVLVTSPKDLESFNDYKNLPHLWSDDKKIRFLATNPDEVHFIFSQIDEVLKERETQNSENKVLPIPHFVVIVTEPGLIEKEALLRYMNDSNNSVGITTLFAYGDITQIPKSCETIIQSNEARTGYYIKNQNENKFTQFHLDPINKALVKSFSDKLTKLNIKRDLRSLGIPESISFLQMYKAGNVGELEIEHNWESNNSARSLAAPVGIISGGETFNLDIHEDYMGCHGLVAGTTGSGKSEFLQEYILSLCVNYSPKEVSFVLVDFKGGDMARPFMAKHNAPSLPHLSATISNLSENTLYRAMVSFEAEIKRRQRLFNEAAISLGIDKLDINSYHRYFKMGKVEEPLPHLIIIIDEFAQLKSQHPEFLTQLINVAQVGRSLGIHLILATQKPSGLVDPQIWSNSRFRVCLRVADKQDSIDMINKPDSALIKNPGRLYIQVGYDEIYECVQSGYSGAQYEPTDKFRSDDEVIVQLTDHSAHSLSAAKLNYSDEKTDKTQLEAVIADIVALGERKNVRTRSLWLEPIPEKIYLDNIIRDKKDLATSTVGLIDLVKSQKQIPLSLDLSQTGHIGIYGASGTGKTTFLQTFIYSMIHDFKYTPEELNIYALDFGGRNLSYLKTLPHTGDVVFEGEDEKIKGLSQLLQSIINERKTIFAQHNVGTFEDFRSISNDKLPAIVVLIDNFATFYEKYYDIADQYIDLISSGRTFGVYFIITGSTRNAINYKATEHISTFLTLKMNDPTNHFEIHNVRPPIIPEDINGRGLIKMDKELVEFQIALAFKTENEAERISRITEFYKTVADGWSGITPLSLSNNSYDNSEETPEEIQVSYSTPAGNSTAKELLPVDNDSNHLVLGTSNSGLLKYGLDLNKGHRLGIVAGGKINLGRVYSQLIDQINNSQGNRSFIFIDRPDELYKEKVKNLDHGSYISQEDQIDKFIEWLKPQLNERLDGNQEYLDEQLFIFISDFNEFFDSITDEQAAFFRKVLTYINKPEYNIFFITGMNANGAKSVDSLFMNLLSNADYYLIGPNSYEAALSKLDGFTASNNLNPNSFYLFDREMSGEVKI